MFVCGCDCVVVVLRFLPTTKTRNAYEFRRAERARNLLQKVVVVGWPVAKNSLNRRTHAKHIARFGLLLWLLWREGGEGTLRALRLHLIARNNCE